MHVCNSALRTPQRASPKRHCTRDPRPQEDTDRLKHLKPYKKTATLKTPSKAALRGGRHAMTQHAKIFSVAYHTACLIVVHVPVAKARGLGSVAPECPFSVSTVQQYTFLCGRTCPAY